MLVCRKDPPRSGRSTETLCRRSMVESSFAWEISRWYRQPKRAATLMIDGKKTTKGRRIGKTKRRKSIGYKRKTEWLRTSSGRGSVLHEMISAVAAVGFDDLFYMSSALSRYHNASEGQIEQSYCWLQRCQDSRPRRRRLSCVMQNKNNR